MKYLKYFGNKNEHLTLYHGTTEDHAKILLDNGWKPNNIIGSNLGNPNYLYITTDPEDARWFSNEKGSDIVLKVNAPIDFIKPDPEDEAGYTIKDLMKRIETTKMPSKFILTKELPNSSFSIYN